MIKKIFPVFLLCPLLVFAQQKDSTDLMKLLDAETSAQQATKYATGAFKTTRLVNAHSIENVGAGVLDVKISHRFGTLNRGLYELFGLDNASIRIGADYGITDWLMVGLGRSSFEKQYDIFLKTKILRQSSGKTEIPFSLSGMAGIYINTLKRFDSTLPNTFSSRQSYVFQALLARKFSEGLSIQVSPTIVHYNLVDKASDKNTIIAVGIGGRQKLTKRVSINVEYFYQIPEYKLEGYENALSVGFDIETGGHVFQLIFTNSTGIAENQYIGKTTGQWGKGDIHFGFNIARVFTLGRKGKINSTTAKK
jgi:opacity protein-like surface antigen